MEVATLLAKLKEGTPNLDLMGWGWSEPDIMYMMTNTESGIGYYRPERYRKLVDEARRVSDLDRRGKIYQDAMKVMLEDAAMVPLWSPVTVVGVRAEVKDFKLGPQGLYVYQDAYVQK